MAVTEDGRQAWRLTTDSNRDHDNIIASPAIGKDGTVYIAEKIGWRPSTRPTGWRRRHKVPGRCSGPIRATPDEWNRNTGADLMAGRASGLFQIKSSAPPFPDRKSVFRKCVADVSRHQSNEGAIIWRELTFAATGLIWFAARSVSDLRRHHAGESPIPKLAIERFQAPAVERLARGIRAQAQNPGDLLFAGRVGQPGRDDAPRR